MARAQLKILLFLIVLGITLGSMAMAYWIYDKVLRPDSRVREEIAELKRADLPRIDPGAKRFDAAVELIQRDQIQAGRDALYRLLQQFPDSPTCAEARRIIGEINLDELFSTDDMAGKKDYIVQPGDSLLRIATNHKTTVDSLIRINGLLSSTLQPGDHLTVVPLEFSVVVDVSAKTVTLRRHAADREYFFKDYQAVDIRLPAGIRPGAEMAVTAKSAVAEGKSVLPTDPKYVGADKWLTAGRAGGRSSVLLRKLPSSKTPPAAAGTGAGAGTAAQSGAAAAPEPGPTPVDVPAPELGVFLTGEDLEELFALVRNGSKLYFVR